MIDPATQYGPGSPAPLRRAWGALRLGRTALLVALLTAGAGREAAAQDARPLLPTELSSVAHHHWGVGEGLPVQSIRSLAVGPDGALWVGTEEGLVRFDGTTFRGTDSLPVPTLPAVDITDLSVSPDGSLLVGTRGAGLFRLSEDARAGPLSAAGAPAEVVSRLLETEDGTVWIGTRGSGLLRLAPGEAPAGVQGDELPNGLVTALAEGTDGSVWVGTRGGLARIRDDTLSVVSLDPLGALPEVEGLTVALGRLWVSVAGARPGLYSFPEDGGAPGRLVLPDVIATRFLEDSRGRLWLGTVDRGVGLLPRPGEEIRFFSVEDGLSANFVSALAEDSLGGVWVGTASAGLNLLRQGRVASLTEADGLSSPTTLAVARGRADTMWVGTAGGGVNRVHPDGSVDHPFRGLLPSPVVISLLQESGGTLWVGTRSGLARLDGGAPRVFTTEDGLPSSIASALALDPTGGLWVGTAAGLARIDGDRVTPLAGRHGLTGEVVHGLIADSAGVILGSRALGVVRFSGDTVRSLSGPPFDSEVMALYRQDGETLWAATANDGLLRIRGGRSVAFGEAQGLPSNEVHSILPDGLGRIWVCTNRGAFGLSLAGLDSVAAGSAERLRPIHLDRDEGMPSSECNGAVDPPAAVGPDGRLWFPTMGGVAIVDPAAVAPLRHVPPPRVEAVAVGDSLRRGSALRGARLPPGSSRLEFQFEVPAPSLLGEVEYRHRLRGVDADWLSVGGRRTATYTNLGPGSYTFELEARAPAGEWVPPTLPLEFSVAPHPWRNPWIVGPLFLLALAGVVVLVRLRIRALHRRNAELQELIREREEAEQAAERFEFQLRDVMERASELVIRTDATGRILSANPAARAALGLEETELRDVRIQDHIRWRDPEAASQDLAPLMEGTLRDALVDGPDGEARILEVSGQRIPEDRGGPGFLLVGRDLTDRRRLQAQVRQSQKMEAVGNLAAGVAHDFNNVLAVIMSTAGLARLEVDPGPVREEIDQILEAARHGASLTKQLLQLSRPAQVGEQKEEVDLNDVALGVAELLRRSLGEGIDLEVRTSVEPRTVIVAVDQIRQIILNLAMNARDAMEGRGRLIISVKGRRLDGTDGAAGLLPAGPYVAVSVQDDGPGIPDEHLPHIFEPFYTTKRRERGTGLGLATALGIAREHGGLIQVESEPGAGATFTLLLPATPGADEAEDRHTVLIVEDDEDLALILAAALRKSGFQARTATTAEAGRALLHGEEAWHAVVLDVHLPDGDGVELAREIRERGIDAPILLVSGTVTDRMVRVAEGDPSVEVMGKPFSLDAMLDAIRRGSARRDPRISP